MPRLVRALLSAVLVGGVLVLGMSAVARASVGDKKLTKCATKSASKGIAKALDTTFNAETGIDAAKVIDLTPDQVDAFAAALQQIMDAGEAAGSSTPPVKAANVKPTCTGKTKADFTYDVANAEGSVVSPSLQGDAVLKKGKWLLDPVNVCDNFAHSVVAAQLAAAAACYSALGIEGATVCDPRDFTCFGPPRP